MTPQYEDAHITHDTRRIISVDDATCALFGCEPEDLIDQRLVDGVYSTEMQWLARLRLDTIRDKGEMPPQDLPFYRHNHSMFWGRCKTRYNTDNTYITTIQYLYEY